MFNLKKQWYVKLSEKLTNDKEIDYANIFNNFESIQGNAMKKLLQQINNKQKQILDSLNKE